MLLNLNKVLFLAHLCVLCTGLRRNGWPEYNYYPEIHGWMKLHIEPVDWLAARMICHMEGAFLTSPWTAEFTSTINKLQRPHSEVFTEDALPALYSGVHTTFAEGAFTYIKGKPAISLHPGDLVGLERCGVFFANGTTGDVDCDWRLPYVCYTPAHETEPIEETINGSIEEPAVSLTLSPDCGEKSLGYEFSKKTRQCYKFHAQAVDTWNSAKTACEEEGAHLAIVNSDDEAQVLVKLFEKYPPEKIHGTPFPDTAAIGFFYETSSGRWKTIHDETLESAGYSAWRPKAPHSLATFGFICRDGLLYGYVPEIGDVPFICEKNPSKLKPELEPEPEPELEHVPEYETETKESTDISFEIRYREVEYSEEYANDYSS